MKPSRVIIIAVVASFLVHSVFFASSRFIMFSGLSGLIDQTQKMFRLQGIRKDSTGKSMAEGLKKELHSIKMSRQGMTRDGKVTDSMFEQEQDLGKSGMETKKEKMRSDKLGKEITSDKKEFDVKDMIEEETSRSQKEVSPEVRTIEKELLSAKKVKFPVIAASARQDMTVADDRAVVFQPISSHRKWSPDEMSAYQAGAGEVSALSGAPRLGEYEDIGQFLNVMLYTYEDEATGENYFKIILRANDVNDLEVLPKEVMFLIDSSKSITGEKLEYIKKGLLSSLKELNPGDRFNVVAFRGNLIKYKDSPIRATDRTVRDARPFIRKLEAVGQTDVENALYGIIGEPMTYKPSYIVLVTDGRPTTGMLDSREIIQQITRANGMERPIFCFGGGLRVNKYLLDFISYQNRGWRHFAAKTRDIEDDFERFFQEINDPVLLDVRYRVSGLDIGKMYPKFLSDFYKGRPFVIYGRYSDEKDFSFQLLGSVKDTTKEFIFNASLQNAIPGGEEIAREWAFTKVYHLISEQTMGIGNPARLQREITELSAKYDITTPYDLKGDAD